MSAPDSASPIKSESTQSQIRMQRLIWVHTVCFKKKKKKKWKSTPDTPKIGNGLSQLIRMDGFMMHIWVKMQNKKYGQSWKITHLEHRHHHQYRLCVVYQSLLHRLKYRTYRKNPKNWDPWNNYKGACAQQNDLCTQRRLRSAWASPQSDQSLLCPHEETLGP